MLPARRVEIHSLRGADIILADTSLMHMMQAAVCRHGQILPEMFATEYWG